MQRTRPLPNTNPEFSVLECPGYREYRVENWHLARDGSGRVVRGTLGWTWREAVIPVVVSIVWPKVFKLFLFETSHLHEFSPGQQQALALHWAGSTVSLSDLGQMQPGTVR